MHLATSNRLQEVTVEDVEEGAGDNSLVQSMGGHLEELLRRRV